MKRKIILAGILVLLVAGAAYADGGKQLSVMRFTNMFGVDGLFIGGANPIRGIPGDELPWEIESANGSLGTDGHLRLHVRGVVFKNDPSVPPDLRGINDEPTFRAVVSCQGNDGFGNQTTINVTTDPAVATRSGNADFDSLLKLPEPCAAPVILVISGDEDYWFTVTGLEGAD